MRKTAITAIFLAGALALAGCSSTSSGAGTTADSAGSAGEEAANIDAVKVMVPADPGGGWDQTGRAMAAVLVEDGLIGSAPVTNVGGAGGTVGLANLANEQDPNTLMLTGLVMVGAVETNASATRIEDMTPIARLTEEPLIVVVPADSEYETLEDLVDGIDADGQAVTVTGGSSVSRGLASLGIGLFIGLIGTDLLSGQARYTLGLLPLADGVDVVLVAVGLFAVGETLYVASRLRHGPVQVIPMGASWRRAMKRDDWRRSWKPWLRGTAIGFPIGTIPAGGADVATFLSYATEKKLSKHKQEFGRGAIEGVAGPESANNAAAAGVLVPLLTLGLPTTATAAGAVRGALTLVQASAVADRWGAHAYGRLNGVLAAPVTAVTALAPGAAAAIATVEGSYQAMAYTMAAACLAGGLLAVRR